MNHDLPLSVMKPWATTLAGFHASNQSYDLESTLAAIAAGLDEEVQVLELLSPQNDSKPDSAVIQVLGMSYPIVIGGAPVDRSQELHRDFVEQCRESSWMTVVETMLNPECCLEDYQRLAEVLFAIGDIVAVVDQSTQRWFFPEEFQKEMFERDVPPNESFLWQTQMYSTSEDLSECTSWVHTTGLLRCGMVDFEMLEVPGKNVHQAVRLLDACASLALESGPPPMKEPWEIGNGVSVCILPWAEAIECLSPSSLGTIEHRENLGQGDPNPLLAERAVVCDAMPRGSFKQVYSWPQEAIAQLDEMNASLLQSERVAVRNQILAGNSWARVAEAFSKTKSETVLMAGVPVGKAMEGVREIGWVQVDACSKDGGVGRLLRQSSAGVSGENIEFNAAEVKGWKLAKEQRTISQLDGIDPLAFAEGRA
jgi:hypothetical protein